MRIAYKFSCIFVSCHGRSTSYSIADIVSQSMGVKFTSRIVFSCHRSFLSNKPVFSMFKGGFFLFVVRVAESIEREVGGDKLGVREEGVAGGTCD